MIEVLPITENYSYIGDVYLFNDVCSIGYIHRITFMITKNIVTYKLYESSSYIGNTVPSILKISNKLELKDFKKILRTVVLLVLFIMFCLTILKYQT